MNKLFQAFLSGIFFSFIIDFFIFLSLKINYIDFYDIKVYYNTLFADNQNIFIFSFGVVLFGYITIYLKNKILKLTIFLTIFLLSLFPLIPQIGKSMGELLFLKKNIVLKDKKYKYKGNILYNGRSKITFFDTDINKTILLNKGELIK